ncbi:hypothetical protein [Eggerthella sp. YY7918]|uniref:hypothetical protein n=1 Tax=Eggerthella sp. (strain YY7918) TaxID=502558 RepID=UPI00021716D2|nr:hypothetical protein [Eggerthella sp. YY7918]BAK45569.1 pseudouridylate synthase [Eggerthella sp. YY7918]
MKIQFVQREDEKIVGRGNIVDVVSTECGWYRIVDDMGDECLVPPSVVEVVEKLPTPPETQPLGIETDEE